MPKAAQSVKMLVRQVILDNVVRTVEHDVFKVLILDAKALRIIDAVIDMSQLLDENVALVQSVDAVRPKCPQMSAIYFLAPNEENLAAIISDFIDSVGVVKSTDQLPYANAHIVFTSPPPKHFLDDLQTSAAHKYIISVTHLAVDFKAVESRVVMLDCEPTVTVPLIYGRSGTFSDQAAEYESVARSIASICIQLDEFPRIRFSGRQRYDTPNRRMSVMVHKMLRQHQRSNENFAVRTVSQPESTLLILDRGLDIISPLLHDFGYQALMNDLLSHLFDDDGRKYRYKYQAGGSTKEKEVKLDEENDDLYAQLRHQHIATCNTGLAQQFREFVNVNVKHDSASPSLKNDTLSNLDNLRDAMASTPEYLRRKGNYAVHLDIAKRCMQQFQSRQLDRVASAEQDMATGKNLDGKEIPMALIDETVTSILTDPSIDDCDKRRLILVYGLRYGVEKKEKICDEADYLVNQWDVAEGLRILRSNSCHVPSSKLRTSDSGATVTDLYDYELSRHVPKMKHIVRALIAGKLEEQNFPTVIARPVTGGRRDRPVAVVHQPDSPVQVNACRPSWQVRRSQISLKQSQIDDCKPAQVPDRRVNGRVIVFVLGGVTYAEIRAMYELADDLEIDIVVGSTNILTPQKFLENTALLGQLPSTAPDAPSKKNSVVEVSNSANTLLDRLGLQVPAWLW